MSKSTYDIAVVGAGKAGSQVVASLRDEHFEGTILLIGDESWLPYDRPPLSKAFLRGSDTAEDLVLRTHSTYEEQRIDLELGTPVVAIDRLSHQIELDGGRQIGYTTLVLATGAKVRPLPFPGVELGGVTGLRVIEDAVNLRRELEGASTVVVIGGGFIGLEVAALAATTFGCAVTLVEALPQLMSRTGLPDTARYIEKHQRSLGVEVLLNTPVKGLREGDNGRVDAVVLGDDRELVADVVVYGIGVIPGVELATAAGLSVGNGILVDEFLRTSDPAIWAIGDCAAYPSAFTDGIIRLESVQNATDQARYVARQIIFPTAEPYRSVPWFWSDQAELRVQTAGITTNYDETVVLGTVAEGAFSVLAFRNGRFLGGDSVNAAGDHRAIRKLLAADFATWSDRLTPEICEESGFSLRDFAKTVASSDSAA